jgi:hypothetical protein
MLAKRTCRGVLICFRGDSAVVILQLEFYSICRGCHVIVGVGKKPLLGSIACRSVSGVG